MGDPEAASLSDGGKHHRRLLDLLIDEARAIARNDGGEGSEDDRGERDLSDAIALLTDGSIRYRLRSVEAALARLLSIDLTEIGTEAHREWQRRHQIAVPASVTARVHGRGTSEESCVGSARVTGSSQMTMAVVISPGRLAEVDLRDLPVGTHVCGVDVGDALGVVDVTRVEDSNP